MTSVLNSKWHTSEADFNWTRHWVLWELWKSPHPPAVSLCCLNDYIASLPSLYSTQPAVYILMEKSLCKLHSFKWKSSLVISTTLLMWRCSTLTSVFSPLFYREHIPKSDKIYIFSPRFLIYADITNSGNQIFPTDESRKKKQTILKNLGNVQTRNKFVQVLMRRLISFSWIPDRREVIHSIR